MHRTNAQRRRSVKDERKMSRRRRPGWFAVGAAVKAVVRYDSRAALSAMDARLDRSGMRRVQP